MWGLSLTAIIYAVIGLLVLRALLRKPQAIMVVLAVAFVAAMLAAQHIPRADLRPVLTAIDSLVVAAMVPLWIKYHSNRARTVSMIGMCQVGWAILAGGLGSQWNIYAGFENVTFAFQVLVAGGDADGIAAWLADRWTRLRSRGAGLVGHLGG